MMRVLECLFMYKKCITPYTIELVFGRFVIVRELFGCERAGAIYFMCSQSVYARKKFFKDYADKACGCKSFFFAHMILMDRYRGAYLVNDGLQCIYTRAIIII